MKKYKLHQWLPLLFALVFFTACNQKEYPGNSSDSVDKYESAKPAAGAYTPPPVISIPDDLAKANKEGEMYYDNEYGYRYWRLSDGKYYLDAKYNNAGVKPAKKLVKKKHKKSMENDYAHE